MADLLEIPLGWPYHKRLQFLKELKDSQSPKYGDQVRFQGKLLTLSVYSVEIDLPKYRLANGRTQAAQEEYLAKNPNLGADFFTRDLEADSAQRAQHHLLKTLVGRKGLFDYFRNPATQQEQPLILTHQGFVVNGNRRLCAMRELYYSDKVAYGRYSHVDVLVLPVCSDKDVDELEAYLQIQGDIKDEYSWIALACMLRVRQHSHNYSIKDLAEQHGKSERDIEAALTQLALVDSYLDSRGWPKQYDRVTKDMYAFQQLYKGRQSFRAQEDKKDFFTQMAYCLIERGDSVGDRLYERIPELKESIDDIADAVEHEIPVVTVASEASEDYQVLGIATEPSRLGMLAQALSQTDSDKRDGIVDIAIDVLDSRKAAQRQRSKANAVLKEVIEANTHLKTAVTYIENSASRSGVEEQLRAIDESVAKLRAWIAKDA